MGRYLRPILALILLSATLLYLLRPDSSNYESIAAASISVQLAPTTGLGSGFTYQGQIKKDGVPINANCDFTFRLWDAAGNGSPPSGGNQIGAGQTLNGVQVSNGLFTVVLNSAGQFGSSAFNGDARWLQISVTCPGDSGATTLSPRQPITPAPYALVAPGSAYQNVVIVAKSGGDFASVQAALDSILDAGPANPYLVWVAPGWITETLIMKPYVDIEGAGQGVTKITYHGSGTNTSATVITADNAELRSLTVENTGGAAYAIAILNDGTSPRLTDITARAFDDGNISAAVFNTNSAAPIIRSATLEASGGGFNHYALYSVGSVNLTLYDSNISAFGGGTNNYAILSTTASTANIHRSILWGTTAAVHMINSTGRIAISQLIGGATTAAAGSEVCVGAYDQSFVALNFNCQ